ncbi:zinc finger CCCH domain-containing protein 14-like [Spinacia oleracea]|uniref:Zinc finger CCCH domain-containing protein 14-like n=1 Tax=Spinacia oleracea TaxID=3562 RepID=A0A9R0J9D1_SPIOL|nr:zinc finger CCCH domain-containing protein 14-like [Spinacia oleracea]
MDFGGPRKRGRHDAAVNGNGGFKKSRPESESFQTGVGSKSKPCTKFFSTSGCPFGEGCHFLHHVPGGFKAVSQMMNHGGAPVPPPSRNLAGPPSFSDGPAGQAGKTKMCNKFNSPEGCKYGDKCHFSHGDRQLGRPSIPSYEDPRGMGYMGGRMGGRMEPPPPGLGAGTNFGDSISAKVSIDASLAGAVIGKSGTNSKQICRVTGVKLAIRDHETDSNKRNIELEGTFHQIKQASSMVQELIRNVKAASGPPARQNNTGHGAPGGGSNFKTRLCENFTKGSCTFGDRCHFAHGADEMRKSAI